MSNQPDVDQLAAHLASTRIKTSQIGQWVYFPPGTTIDKQLLILAGVEDYPLSHTDSQKLKAMEVRRYGGIAETNAAQNVSAAGNEDIANRDAVQNAMSQHLTSLRDAKLANMLHASLHINHNSQPTAPSTPPCSPLFSHCPPSAPARPSRTPQHRISSSAPPTYTVLPPLSSCPPGSSQLLRDWYLVTLQSASSPQALLHAPLPCDADELEDLSVFMAQHVGAMIEQGQAVVFSPLAHPCHPLWVPWQRQENVGGKEEDGSDEWGVEGWDEGIGKDMEMEM